MTPEQLEVHRVRFEQHSAQHFKLTLKDVINEREGFRYLLWALDDTWQAYQWAIADADRAQRASPGVQVVGMRDGKYVDSTPKLHVGSSSLEDWYQAHEKACTGDKQLARDAYAAGMGDPLVTYLQPPQQSTQPVEILKQLLFEAKAVVAHLRFARTESPHTWIGHHDDAFVNAECVVTGLTTLSAAASAQPVEVQRVPLTKDQRRRLIGGFFAEEWAQEAANGLLDDVESHYGIKPTSGEWV